MNIKILISLLFLSSCATHTLAPSSVRQVEFMEPIDIPQDNAFDIAQVWFAKSFGNSNSAIRLTDPKNRTIVAQGNASCNVLNLGSGWAEGQRVDFTMTFKIKKSKFSLKFEDVIAIGDAAYDSGLRPSSDKEMALISDQCLKPFALAIKSNMVLGEQ